MDSYINNQFTKGHMQTSSSRGCKFDGCTVKRPNFGYRNINIPMYCKQHKLKDMVDIRSPVCKFDGCIRRATFGYVDDNIKQYCSKHKKLKMIDLNNRKRRICAATNCSNRLNKNESKFYCKNHKSCEINYNNISYCIEPGCDIKPYYNHKNESNGLYCQKHKHPDMVDVVNNYKVCNNSITYSEKRIMIIFEINNLTVISNKAIIKYKAYIRENDHIFDCGTHYLIVELDPDQLMGENFDNIRMKNIGHMAGRPIWFIRYNPAKYRKFNGRKQVSGDSQSKRNIKLLECVKYCYKTSPKSHGDYIRAVLLYYDGWDGANVEISVEPIQVDV